MLNRLGYIIYSAFSVACLISAVAYYGQTGKAPGAIALAFFAAVLALSARSCRSRDREPVWHEEAFMTLNDSDLKPIDVDSPAGHTSIKLVDNSDSSTDRLDPPPPESSVGTDEDTAVTAMVGDDELPDPPRHGPPPQSFVLRGKLHEAERIVRAAHSEGRIGVCLGVIIVPNSLGRRDVDQIRARLADEAIVHDDLDTNVSDELTGGAIIWLTNLTDEAITSWQMEIGELVTQGTLYATWSPCLPADTRAWHRYVELMNQMLATEHAKTRHA